MPSLIMKTSAVASQWRHYKQQTTSEQKERGGILTSPQSSDLLRESSRKVNVGKMLLMCEMRKNTRCIRRGELR